MKHIHALVLIVATVVGVLGFAYCTGCAPRLTPQTKQQIAQVQQTTAITAAKVTSAATVKLAKVNAKATVKAAQGKTNPLAHPIAAVNNIAVELHPILLGLTIGFGIAAALSYSLSKTPLKILSGLTPAWVCMFILNGLGLVFLPWILLDLLIVGAAFVAMVIYFLIKRKGNVVEAVEDVDDELYGLTGHAGTIGHPIEINSSTPIITLTGPTLLAASPPATSPAVEPPNAPAVGTA